MNEDEFNEEANIYDQKNYVDTETLKSIYYRQFWNLFDEYCNAEKKDFVKTKLQETINILVNKKEALDKKTFLSKKIINEKNYLEEDEPSSENKEENSTENKKSDIDLYNDFLEKLKIQSVKRAAKKNVIVERDETEFVRSYSLTEKEVDKMNDWEESHYNKYHKKDDEEKYKRNPFYGGVSPVSKYKVEWMTCSIGTSADCVCVECSKKCDKLNRKINKLNKKLCSTEEKNKREKISKKIVNITGINKEIYNESRFCVRELDD